jgi:hypothetical protein
LVAYLGVIVLAIAAVAGTFLVLQEFKVSQSTSLWLAPLAVGGVLAIVGAVLVFKAVRTIGHENALPKHTVASIRDDARWVKERAGGAL